MSRRQEHGDSSVVRLVVAVTRAGSLSGKVAAKLTGYRQEGEINSGWDVRSLQKKGAGRGVLQRTPTGSAGDCDKL